VPNSPPWELFKEEQRIAEILNIVRIFDRGLFGGYPFTIMGYPGGGGAGVDNGNSDFSPVRYQGRKGSIYGKA